jgi:hypothetical protein
MKKTCALFVLFCVFAVSAFAQLNVGAYARSYWVPYRYTQPDGGKGIHSTAVQAPWGEPDISAGINIDGWTEWGGLHLGVDIAGGAGNNAQHPKTALGSGWVWVTPLDFIPVMKTFKIYAGTPNDDTLTGKIGGSDLATYVLTTQYKLHDFRLELQNPEYNTFTRFNPYNWGAANHNTQNLYWPRIGGSVLITWEPFKNFFFGAFIAPEMFDLKGWTSIGGANYGDVSSWNSESPQRKGIDDSDIDQDFYNTRLVYRRMQAGVGYTLPGIGFARAQYVGVRNVVEAAFHLTALGDLALEVGFKVPFEGTDKNDPSTYKRRRDIQASLAATYRNYGFRLLGRVDTAFLGSDSSVAGGDIRWRGLNLRAYLIPSYQISIGSVGMDFGFEYEQADDFNKYLEDGMKAGMGLWFARDMGNAKIKFAAVTRFPMPWKVGPTEYARPEYWTGNNTNTPFDIMFPIILSVGF